jgi:UDP-3-O-[3-hydroxymyristoyl] glucosamine N-acyltransferase
LSSTLSQKGNCWIYDNATVKEGAEIYDNAKIKDNATVGGMKCWVFDDAIVSGCDVWDCEISGKAFVDYDVEDKEITK